MNHKISEVRTLTRENEKNTILLEKYAREMTKLEKMVFQLKAKLQKA
jgi:hypothetical protein